MELKSFKVEKLHGLYNFELRFQNNKLILVGENGSGKSTLMKMLFYVLSCQWSKLAQYKFDKVIISIDQLDNIEINKSSLDLSRTDQRISQLPTRIQRLVLQEENLSIIEMECSRFGFPFQYILQIMNSIHKGNSTLKEKSEQIRNATNGTCILYLPTYRRIEQDLSVVLSSRIDSKIIDKDVLARSSNNRRWKHINNYSEIIEFGMGDVEYLTNSVQNNLKDKWSSIQSEIIFSFLNDAFNKNITKIEPLDLSKIDSTTIQKILSRVDQKYLPDIDRLVSVCNRANFGNIKEDDKVIFYYLRKVLEALNKFDYEEKGISSFTNVCNKYLFNKIIKYNQSDFSLCIKARNDDNVLRWNHLSSGEKQIVSLFAHMYLDNSNKYFLLIDEPELSLSLEWQKMFLDDLKNGAFCDGLFAVTHSPFVFNNSLKEYAHGINEFRR